MVFPVGDHIVRLFSTTTTPVLPLEQRSDPLFDFLCPSNELRAISASLAYHQGPSCQILLRQWVGQKLQLLGASNYARCNASQDNCPGCRLQTIKFATLTTD